MQLIIKALCKNEILGDLRWKKFSKLQDQKKYKDTYMHDTCMNVCMINKTKVFFVIAQI